MSFDWPKSWGRRPRRTKYQMYGAFEMYKKNMGKKRAIEHFGREILDPFKK